MPRRERTPGRRPPRREPRLRALIVCAAEQTESAYFKGLRDWLAARSIDVKVVERSRAPDQVVEYARDHCGYHDFDAAWCVVDVDEYEAQGGKLTAAAALARRAGIHLAASNPCFEYWLLLHHDDSASPSPRCAAVADRLRRFVPSYDKVKLRFDDFSAGVEVAVARAKRRDPTGKDHSINPSSGVWTLVDALLAHRREETRDG